jgi:thiol:disulfide interchange protein
MSALTYNTITAGLLIGVVTAFVVMVVSAIAMIARWKTPNRRMHAVRLFIALAAIPCLIGVQQALLWLVFIPSLGRQQMAQVNAAREERLADTSLVRVSDPVPQFSLTTADGVEFSLPDDDKVTLINFFATWCGPCQMELPHIEQIWKANKSNEDFRMLIPHSAGP